MHTLQKEQFEQLANFDNAPCISIFMPTTRAGKDVLEEKDRIQLKSLWKKVVEKLKAQNTDNKKIEEFEKPIEALLKDHDFWLHQQEGLAVLVTKDHFQKFITPFGFEPKTYVSDHFYLKPLVPLLADESEFYLLALQIEKVQFFKANQHSINELKVGDLVPSRLEKRVGFDHEAKTRLRQSLGGGKSVFQGDDAANRDRKNEILRYFNAIDAGLQSILRNQKIPLVVACQDYLFPIYKKANTYGSLFPEDVPGNPSDFKNISELHRSACQVLEPYFNKERKEKITEFEELVPERKATDIHEILPAIFEGRVDALFLQENEDIWGNFNENMASVEVNAAEGSNNISLMNLAVVKTIQQNGTVYLAQPEDMPVRNSTINAIFRY